MSRRFSALSVLISLVLVVSGSFASIARADGDPGSDVLVNQNLFVDADANISDKQQAELGDLLQAAGQAGFPIRVAIIATKYDLGAITQLWHEPQAYAGFLGYELSLEYTHRLLVVMPNGFGFYWQGHSDASASRLLAGVSINPRGSGLVGATVTAIRRLTSASGIKLGAPTPATSAGAIVATPSTGNATVSSGRGADETAAVLAAAVVALLAVAGAIFGLRGRPGFVRLRQRVRARAASAGARTRRRGRIGWVLPTMGLVAALAIAEAVFVIVSASSSSPASALASNPNIDPGTALSRPAPDFTLTDQFGNPASLRRYRGKVVVLAFTDSECTTICPLTTAAMLDAKAMLGSAASQVELLGVDANPNATSIEDVWSYSNVHGMLRDWSFLTGSLPQLERVWRQYGIEADIQRGLISHTPALFVIDPQGRLRKLYITQQSYAAIGQFGQVLAQEVSSLLPRHPAVHSNLSYSEIAPTQPTSSVSLPREGGGGAVRLGPGTPRLLVFFATWDQEVTSLGGQLEALNRYESAAGSEGLPRLTAVDEGAIEPSDTTLTQFVHGLRGSLSYPVGIDRSGQVADGYQVQGLPWLALTSSTGQILWYWEPDTSGWLSTAQLEAHVRGALAREPKAPSSAAQVERELAGSPPLLATLHAQAGQMLGSEPALAARIRALRGYPIVVNAWASWCTPCRSEFGLFADASSHYGRKVAFLGADTDDSLGDAKSFLQAHPVSYPSYQTTTSQLDFLLPGGPEGLPTTIYINPAGKVVYVHDGQYDSQGTLDEDIESYALDG